MHRSRFLFALPLVLSIATSCSDPIVLIGRWEMTGAVKDGKSKLPGDSERFIEFRADGLFSWAGTDGSTTGTGSFERVGGRALIITTPSVFSEEEEERQFRIDRLDADRLTITGGQLNVEGMIQEKVTLEFRRASGLTRTSGVMVKCANCDRPNGETLNYCQACGAKLK